MTIIDLGGGSGGSGGDDGGDGDDGDDGTDPEVVIISAGGAEESGSQ